MPKPSSVRNSFEFLFPQTPGLEPVEGSLFLLDINRVKPTAGQPRTTFPARARAELAANIRELRERGAGVGGTGILQPIQVRSDPSDPSGGGYLITAGERRYWAARDAGNTLVPVLIREQSEAQAFEEALVENIQRHDLSNAELAVAYQKLIDEHGLSMREVARRVGKSASEVSRAIAIAGSPLLSGAVERGEVTASQAQEILPASEPRQAELITLVATRRLHNQPLSLPELREHVRGAQVLAESGVALRNTQPISADPPEASEASQGVALRNTQAPDNGSANARKQAAQGHAEPDGAAIGLAPRLRRVTLQLQALREAAAMMPGTDAQDTAAALAELKQQDAAVKAIRSALKRSRAE